MIKKDIVGILLISFGLLIFLLFIWLSSYIPSHFVCVEEGERSDVFTFQRNIDILLKTDNWYIYMIDKKETYYDIKGGKKKGLDDYQKAYFDARLGCLQEIYDDCNDYEWRIL